MSSEKNHTLISGLTRLLASALVLNCKTRLTNWSLPNGANSKIQRTLHGNRKLLDNVCHQLAKRISCFGGKVPTSYSRIFAISSVKFQDVDNTEQRLEQLSEDHRQLVTDTNFLVTILETTADEETEQVLQSLVQENAACAKKLSDLVTEIKI